MWAFIHKTVTTQTEQKKIFQQYFQVSNKTNRLNMWSKNLQNARLQISYFFLSYFYCLSGLLNFYFLPFSQNIQIQNFENISIWCCGNLYFCYYNIILSLLYYYLCYKLAVKYICKYEKDAFNDLNQIWPVKINVKAVS